jgi:hypothetical protein
MTCDPPAIHSAQAAIRLLPACVPPTYLPAVILRPTAILLCSIPPHPPARTRAFCPASDPAALALRSGRNPLERTGR